MFGFLLDNDFLMIAIAFHSIIKLVSGVDELGAIASFIEPVLDLMHASFEQPRLREFQRDAFDLMNLILSKATLAALPFLETIWSLYMRAEAGYSRLPLASLAKYFGSDFDPFVPQTVDFLLATFPLAESAHDFMEFFGALQLILRSHASPIEQIARLLFHCFSDAAFVAEQRGNLLLTLDQLLKWHFSDCLPFVDVALTAVRYMESWPASDASPPTPRAIPRCSRLLCRPCSRCPPISPPIL
jgi:hypothetical protein